MSAPLCRAHRGRKGEGALGDRGTCALRCGIFRRRQGSAECGVDERGYAARESVRKSRGGPLRSGGTAERRIYSRRRICRGSRAQGDSVRKRVENGGARRRAGGGNGREISRLPRFDQRERGHRPAGKGARSGRHLRNGAALSRSYGGRPRRGRKVQDESASQVGGRPRGAYRRTARRHGGYGGDGPRAALRRRKGQRAQRQRNGRNRAGIRFSRAVYGACAQGENLACAAD